MPMRVSFVSFLRDEGEMMERRLCEGQHRGWMRMREDMMSSRGEE